MPEQVCVLIEDRFHLVELHQGRVELESEVGKGSRFTVVLRRQPDSQGSR